MKNTNLKNTNKFFTNPIVVVICALICCGLWGSATPFIKTGYQVMFPEGGPDVPSTILFAGMRFFLAGIITIAIYSIARRKFLYPKKENLGVIGIVACFQTIIQYIFFYIGLANTSGTKGTVLSGSSTFFAILISALIFKQEKLTVKKILACIIGFAGIIVVNLDGLDWAMNFTGDCFVIFSAISLAISSVLIKKFSSREDPVVISGYQFMLGGLVMIIAGLAFGGRVDLTTLKGDMILLYLAFLSAIAYALWGILLKYNPVSKVTIFTFTTPIIGVLLTKAMLPNEDAKVGVWNLVIALVLVCIGVCLLNYQKPQKAVAEVENTDETDNSNE